MNLWIDCEWNGYGGDLISMALISTHNDLFYEVLPCEHPVPWVQEHVMPKLNQPPGSREHFQQQLEAFLGLFPAAHVIADWPEDIAWLCRMIITGPGQRILLPPLTFEIYPFDSHSLNPHCAVSDACGLKSAWLAWNRKPRSPK